MIQTQREDPLDSVTPPTLNQSASGIAFRLRSGRGRDEIGEFSEREEPSVQHGVGQTNSSLATTTLTLPTTRQSVKAATRMPMSPMVAKEEYCALRASMRPVTLQLLQSLRRRRFSSPRSCGSFSISQWQVTLTPHARKGPLVSRVSVLMMAAAGGEQDQQEARNPRQ